MVNEVLPRLSRQQNGYESTGWIRSKQETVILHGGFEFSEGTKWIFYVEIEKLRAEIFLHVEKSKSILDGEVNS